MSRYGDYDSDRVTKPNWLSIKLAKKCAFSRRNGIRGKIILGYSIRLRLFNKDII